MALKHFPYQHPTFGTAKNPKTASHWKLSVYYWWYEYLKRNEEYRKTCTENGQGKYSSIYEDFRDVTVLEFKQWWTEDERGAYLFAEPPTPSIRLVPPAIVEQGGFQRQNTLILEVPLDLPMTYLIKNFHKVVSKFHEGKRGHRHSVNSQAKYVVKGKVDVAFLETALMVWDQRQANPKKPLWQIAKDLGLGGNNRINANDTPAERTNKMNVLAATTSRYYRKAGEMITRSAEGRFPN